MATKNPSQEPNKHDQQHGQRGGRQGANQQGVPRQRTREKGAPVGTQSSKQGDGDPGDSQPSNDGVN